MSRHPIETRIMSDDEEERLYRRYPHIGRSPDKWCPTCDKRGWYLWQDEKVECNCYQQHALHKWYLASGIGVTYQRLDWTDFDGPKEITEGICKYLDHRKEFMRRGLGLFLSGEIGTGKSMVANLALKEMVKWGFTCWAATFSQTLQMFTAGWGGASGKRDAEYFQQKFLYSQVVLLDDIGKEMRGKAQLAEATFDAILRQRVQEGRPTFISSNLTGPEVEEGYGAAALSLIREKSLEEVFVGTDYRPTANKREVTESLKGWTRPIV